jgi:signal transduction histidine kinase
MQSNRGQPGTASNFSDAVPGDDTQNCVWEWHPKTNTFHWNGCCSEPRHLSGGMDEFLSFVSPADNSEVRKMIASALRGASLERDITFLPEPHGARRIRLRIAPVCGQSGDVVSLLGFCHRSNQSWSKADERACDATILLSHAEYIADFGTWKFDTQSNCCVVSNRLAHMLGIAPAKQILEQDYFENLHPSDKIAVSEIVRTAIVAKKPFQYVARYYPSAGGVLHHCVRGIPVFCSEGRLKSIIGIVLDNNKQTYADRELHNLTRELFRARDEERRTVARELHESVGQTLAAIKMSLGRLGKSLRQEDHGLQASLHSALELADAAVREVRTLSYLMHPPMLDESGLRSALHWYARGFAERSGISVQVLVPENYGRYDHDIEVTIFRIVQEALTNIHRYSGSRTASIRLTNDDTRICVVIRDEGCGLPVAYRRNEASGVGIAGMRQRVEQLGGKFEIESTPGKGTTVRVNLFVGAHGAARDGTMAGSTIGSGETQ